MSLYIIIRMAIDLISMVERSICTLLCRLMLQKKCLFTGCSLSSSLLDPYLSLPFSNGSRKDERCHYREGSKVNLS